MPKKMKFEDLTEDRVQIIKLGKQIFNVLRFRETILHNHPYIELMKLNAIKKIKD